MFESYVSEVFQLMCSVLILAGSKRFASIKSHFKFFRHSAIFLRKQFCLVQVYPLHFCECCRL